MKAIGMKDESKSCHECVHWNKIITKSKYVKIRVCTWMAPEAYFKKNDIRSITKTAYDPSIPFWADRITHITFSYEGDNCSTFTRK